jgi:hypothetical protein
VRVVRVLAKDFGHLCVVFFELDHLRVLLEASGLIWSENVRLKLFFYLLGNKAVNYCHFFELVFTLVDVCVLLEARNFIELVVGVVVFPPKIGLGPCPVLVDCW